MSRRKSLSIRVLAPVAALALILTACGGDNGDDEPAADDPDPVEEPEETDDAAEDEAPEPVDNDVSFVFSSVPQVEKVPTIIAIENLEADGFTTSDLYLQSSEDPIQAVIRGDANFGSASASAVFTAINAGADIKAVMQANAPNYVLVAPAGTGDPSGLDGLRTGIHAPVSSTTLYTEIALADYPDTEPEILVVPGSAARIQALAADELDASVVQIADLPTLEDIAPGEFETIWNFGIENADLVDSVIFTRTEIIEDDPGLVQAVIEYNLEAYRAVYDDPDSLTDAIERLVAETDGDLAAELADLHVDAQVWPTDGGMSEQSVEFTIQALLDVEIMEDEPTLSDLYDRGPLDAVLARIRS